MEKPIIGVDIDNVLSATDKRIRELIHKFLGIESNLQDIRNWNYSASLPLTQEEEKFIFNEFHRKHLIDLEALPGAYSALINLSRVYSIWLLTSRPEYTREATVQWLTKNSISFEKLIFTNQKSSFADKLQYIFEDNPRVALDFAQKGIMVILFDYPWNQGINHAKIQRVRGWDQVNGSRSSILYGPH